ncbi:MAG: hypothetical protein Q9184_006800 [Pyrenodesmia sp. 2 TL-2023]
MPPYLCHICSTHNPHPSPLCRHCTHPYCICCLPVFATVPSSFSTIPDSSPPSQTASPNRTPEDEQCEEWLASSSSGSGFAEGETHPAHRRVMLLVGSEGMISVRADDDSEAVYHEEVEKGSGRPAQGEEQKLGPPGQELTPLSTSPITIPPLPPALTHPTTSTTSPSPISTTRQTAPFSFPSWEIPSSTTHAHRHKHKHSRHKSTTTIDEHKAKLEPESRRTMSAQSERVRRLMRKGSMRLREVVMIGGAGKSERDKGISVEMGTEGLMVGLGGV